MKQVKIDEDLYLILEKLAFDEEGAVCNKLKYFVKAGFIKSVSEDDIDHLFMGILLKAKARLDRETRIEEHYLNKRIEGYYAKAFPDEQKEEPKEPETLEEFMEKHTTTEISKSPELRKRFDSLLYKG